MTDVFRTPRAGHSSFYAPHAESLEPRLLMAVAPVVAESFEEVRSDDDTQTVTVDLWSGFDDPDDDVIFRFFSNMGNIDVRMFETDTPGTVENFRRYSQAGRYQDTVIHRSVQDFVVQGGGFAYDPEVIVREIPTYDPITNEFMHSNVRGTIAMAKLGNDPDSATSQWFFNLADNSQNLDNQNGGFTVFGEVIGNGMDVVDVMAQVPVYNYGGAFTDLPLRNHTYQAGPFGLDNFVRFDDIREADALTFTVVANSNPALVSTTVDAQSGQLLVSPNDGVYGTATLTVRATDADGLFVEQSIDVNIQNVVNVDTAGTLRYTDADGDQVTVSVVGDGFAQIVQDGEQTDAESLFLVGTNESSRLYVSVRRAGNGDGTTTIGDITVGGALNQFIAPTTHLGGNLEITGHVNYISLGDVADQHLIELNTDELAADAGDAVTLLLGDVTDATLDTHGLPIHYLRATRWTDTDATRDTIIAPYINTLYITGDARQGIPADFDADLQLDGADAGGTSLSLLRATGEVASTITAGAGQVGTMLVGDWTGNLEADSLAKLVSYDDRARATVNGDVNADITLNAQDARGVSLYQAVIGGSITGGAWTMPGDAYYIRAGQTAAGWSLDTDGMLNVLDVRGDMGGTVQFDHARTIRSWGDYTADLEATGQDAAGVSIYTFMAGRVGTSDLTAPGNLITVRATDWAGGTIAANSLSVLQITGDARNGVAGDFGADVQLAGTDASGLSLRQAVIAGSITGGAWTMPGDAYYIRAGQTADGWSLDADGMLNVLDVRGDMGGTIDFDYARLIRSWGDYTANVSAGGQDAAGVSIYTFMAGRVGTSTLTVPGDLGTVRVTDWADGLIQANAIGTLMATGDARNGIAADFGADVTLTGVDARGLSLTKFYARGQVDSAITANAGGVYQVVVGNWAGTLDAGWAGVIYAIDDRRDPAVNGHVDVDMTLSGTGATGDTLGRALVYGNALGTWDVTGSAGLVRVIGQAGQLTVGGAVDEMWTFGVGDRLTDVSVLQLGDALAATVDATGQVRYALASRWQFGRLEADSVVTLKTIGDARNGIAGDFNANLELHGTSADLRQSLAMAYVAGDVDNSRWDIRGEVGKVYVAGTADTHTFVSTGSVQQLLLGKTVNSNFAAGRATGVGGPANDAGDLLGGTASTSTIGYLRVLGIRGQGGPNVIGTNFTAAGYGTAILTDAADPLSYTLQGLAGTDGDLDIGRLIYIDTADRANTFTWQPGQPDPAAWNPDTPLEVLS